MDGLYQTDQNNSEYWIYIYSAYVVIPIERNAHMTMIDDAITDLFKWRVVTMSIYVHIRTYVEGESKILHGLIA